MPWRRRPQRSDLDFTREIESHIELEVERLMADGMPADDARRAARRRFGNVTRVSERFYESRRVLWLDHLRHDVRCACRSLAKSPIACAVAVTSLSAGIGATTATLTVRNAVFYNPPPLYQDAQQLSRVEVSTPERPRGRVPGALYALWAADADLQSRTVAATPQRPVEIRAGDRTETVRLRAVTPGFFSLLGVQPALGRAFSSTLPADGPSPLVLSHDVWQNVFDGRPDVPGTVVWVDEQPHTVIGVMPERFWFGSTDSPVWGYLRPESVATLPGVDVVVRRPAALTHAALSERLHRDAEDYALRQADRSRDIRVLVSHIGGTWLGDQISIVIPYLVGVAVLLTLLIACANVAILMFARWTGREREMAIRSSLGAGRGRTIALLLTESVVIAVCGGVLGVCATFALRGVFIRTVPGATDFDLSIDHVILLQSAVVAILTGIVSGIAPALYETRRLQTNPLRLIASSDRVRQRWRHALVVLEIAVTVALMVVAAGQVDASRRMLTADVGFPIAPLLSVRVENPAGVDVARVIDSLTLVPGVASVAAGTAVPMAMSAPSELVTSGREAPVAVMAERASITAGYFTTLGVPVRAGRTFTEPDLSARARLVVVNEILAKQLWPDRDAIAAHILIANVPYEVVGVVASYSGNPLGRTAPRVYLPLAHHPPHPTHIQMIVRAAHDPRPVVRRVREDVRRLGPAYVVGAGFTLEQVVETGAKEIMVVTYAMSPLLGIGVFLTATGIFGVLAFAIARRSNELALRVALGATRASVSGLVIGHTLRLLATGAIAGAVGTFALTRMVRAAGGGGSPLDTPGWEAFAIPMVIVLAVGALATWIPARRALTIDPAILLRAE